MAWLHNLAGKAEHLLVKFDQNAANVFNDPNQKLLQNIESNDGVSNIFERPQECNQMSKLPEADIPALLEAKSTNSLKKWVKTSSLLDSSEGPTYSDNVSVISEKSRLSDNEDSGITFNASMSGSKRDTPSPAYSNIIENISKKELKGVEYSCVSSSKSDSLQNSFILMDDTSFKYEDKIAKLEQENEEFSLQLINMRHLYSELQNENSSLQNQLDRVNETISVTQNEMEQYRARAQRILQEKEKLIGLKSNSNLAIASEDKIIIAYNEGLKKELEFQEEKYKAELLKANNELAILQHSFMVAQKENQMSKQVLQDSLINERKVRASIEEDCRVKTKELQSAVHQLSQQNNIISNKSQEVLHLREQVKHRPNFVVNEDLESRLQSLTQTLMSKQNTVEAVTTERNALRLQLEKLEKEHTTVVIEMQRNQMRSSLTVEPDEVKLQVPYFLKISPFDAEVTRKVKHAYSCLDAVSVRTGVFLRRYPLARVFVFCYMVLLHTWVLIILCTYVPTSH